MSHTFKAVFASLALVAAGAIAKGDTITIQLGSAVLNFGTGIPDQVTEAGAIINPALTLGTAQNLTFFTPTYSASTSCTGCTGTGNLVSNGLNVTDMTVSGSGSGTFTQPFSDSVSGSTHTFTPQSGSAINITWGNCDTLVITPLSGTGVAVTAGSSNNSNAVSATFLLEKTPAVPEPTSLSLLFIGLGGTALWKARKRIVQQR